MLTKSFGATVTIPFWGVYETELDGKSIPYRHTATCTVICSGQHEGWAASWAPAAELVIGAGGRA